MRGWHPSIRWTIPDDLPSGVYAVKLTLGESEDYVTFFVGPHRTRQRAPVAFLASTATYLAYANQHLGFSNGVYVQREPRFANEAYLASHPQVGCSLYDHHRDGSGVHYSSRLRPILNLKPKGMPWSFVADTNLIAWLDRLGQRFDVITDEDLHRDGADALAVTRAVITGTHPEYHSTAMLDGLRDWLDGGGRLMYMGGNGFYWRIAYCRGQSGDHRSAARAKTEPARGSVNLASTITPSPANTADSGGASAGPRMHSLASASPRRGSTAARTTGSARMPRTRALSFIMEGIEARGDHRRSRHTGRRRGW